MLVKNCSSSSLSKSARMTGVDLAYEPYVSEGGLRFRLKPMSDGKRRPYERFPFWRTSAGAFNEGRTVCAVCWHGHRDFFRNLFEVEPKARVWTALVRRARDKNLLPKHMTHWNADNFENFFHHTSDINIGSAYRPVRAQDACHCLSGGASVWSANQKRMTGECWLIQFQGLLACTNCEALNTPDCGGQNIRKTLKNEKGHNIPGTPGDTPISRRIS